MSVVVSPGSGSGPSTPPQIEEISGLSNTRYYTFGSDPTAALTQFTAVVMARVAIDAGAFAPRYFIGTRNAASGGGGGGWGIRCAAFGSASTPLFLDSEYIDNGGTERLVRSPDLRQFAQKVMLLVATYDTILGGASTQGELFVNGVWLGANFAGGVTGALTAGGALTVGTSAAGAVAAMDAGWLHGAAFVDRLLSYQEIVTLTEDSLSTFELADISGGWTAGWRVSGADPGTPWTPFAGAGNLTRVGTAATYAVRDNPSPF